MGQYEILEVIQQTRGWITIKDIALKLNKTTEQICPPLNRLKTIKGLVFRKTRINRYIQMEYKFIKSNSYSNGGNV